MDPKYRISEFTGQLVDTAGEAWRHECEIRSILDGITNAHARRAHVNGVVLERYKDGSTKMQKGIRQIRGDTAADKIIEDIRRLHALRQQRRQHPAAA